jgi:hypothetical protein
VVSVFANAGCGSFTTRRDKGSGDAAGSFVSSKETVDNKALSLERKYASRPGEMNATLFPGDSGHGHGHGCRRAWFWVPSTVRQRREQEIMETTGERSVGR